MPAFTMHIPENLTGNSERDIAALKDWGVALIDNLSYMFAHLNESNVTKAASVDAENINTNKALIQSAQIRNLQADKIAAGTLDLTHGITIAGEDGRHKLNITQNSIAFYENGKERFYVGKDGNNFVFTLNDKNGNSRIWMDDSGNGHFLGTIEGGKIISDTTIDVTTDLNIGQNIHMQKLNDNTWYQTGGIYFDSKKNADGTIDDTEASGKIGMQKEPPGVTGPLQPTFMICSPNHGNIEITTGTGRYDTGGDLLLRGANVRIGTPATGNGAVYINNERIVTQSQITELQNQIRDLQNQIDALKGGA